MRGSPSNAILPGTLWSTGTSLSAITYRARREHSSLNMAMNPSAASPSLGRKNRPVP